MIDKPVIVEGPDGGGKSTLISSLMASEGLALAPKFSRSVEGPNQGHVIAAIKDMDDPLKGYVYDRHPAISEPIYGTIVRKKDDYVPLAHYVDSWLDRVYVVICLPPFKVAVENLNVEAQMPGVAENFPLIYGFYEYLLGINPSRFIHYDYTVTDSYNELRSKLNASSE